MKFSCVAIAWGYEGSGTAGMLPPFQPPMRSFRRSALLRVLCCRRDLRRVCAPPA